MNRLSAFFVGDSDLLILCANAFRDAGHLVSGVITSNPAINAWARSITTACIGPGDFPFEDRSPPFDFLFCVGEDTPAPPELIRSARKMAIRFHDSLLPPYTDLHGPSWALIDQEKSYGVTWHDLKASNTIDSVVQQQSIEIFEQETAASLHAKCYEAGFSGFKALLADIDGGGLPAFQPGALQSVMRPPLPPALGTLDFSRPAAEIAALVAGLNFGPLPNCFGRAKIYFGDSVLLLRSARALKEKSALAPGVVVRIEGDVIQVATGDGDILLSGCSDLAGRPPGAKLAAGSLLPRPGRALLERLAERIPAIAQGQPFWEKTYAGVTPIEFPYPHRQDAPSPDARQTVHTQVSLSTSPDLAVAAFFAWLAVTTAQENLSLMYCDPVLEQQATPLQPWLSEWVPMTLFIPRDASTHEAARLMDAQRAQLHRAGPPARDLLLRSAIASDTKTRLHRIGVSVNARALPGDMDLMLAVHGQGRGAEFASADGVFSSAVLASIAAHFSAFLTAFSADAALSGLPLVPAEEAAANAGINHTATPFDSASSVQALVAAQALRTPDHTALCVNGATLSYRELEYRASALAGRLQARGARPGDIVGLCVGRGMDMMIGLLAILKTGAAYLPLDPDYPHDRLHYMIEDSGTALVVTTHALAATLAIPFENACLLDAPDAVSGRHLNSFVEPDSVSRLAYLMYTSGSTGRPKGVLVTQKSLLNLFAGLDATIPHAPVGRWLAAGSFSFDISVAELWWPLTLGFTVVIDTEAKRGWTMAEAMLQYEITHFFCTPSLLAMLMGDMAGRQALSNLSVLMAGGEVFPLQLAREACEVVRGQVFSVYGPTEATVLSTVCALHELDDFVPLGQPIANTTLSVRNTQGTECPAWVSGELLIGGDGVSDGYWRRPELTADKFISDPLQPGGRLYKTGDLVRRRPGGALEFLGRIDYQVKIRGHRIELGEIENVIAQLPGVNEVVVLAREDKFGDKRLVAYVALQDGETLPAAHIQDAVAQTLPPIMVPGAVVSLTAFPLTSNGKIDRQALPAPKTVPDEAAGVVRESALETGIAEVWKQVLRASHVHANDNFFKLGGSLFSGMEVQRWLLATTGHFVSLADLVRFPTVQSLAQSIAPATDGRQPQPGLTVRPIRVEPAEPADDELTLVESAVAAIWRDLFEIAEVNKDDDFFSLGGNSLAAIRMFSKLRERFPVKLPLASLFEASTLAGFSALVEDSGRLEQKLSVISENARSAPAGLPNPRKWFALVPIRTGAPRQPPIFCIHGAGGNVFNFKELSRHLGVDQPVYGLQPQGVDGHLPVLQSIEEMAAQYLSAIRSVAPQGPYRLLGYSAGGVIAFEMAQRLKKAGAEIALLAMIDTLTPATALRKPGTIEKLWLMRHWSLKFALERSHYRQVQQLAEASYADVEERLARGEWLTPELVELHLFHKIVQAQNRYKPVPYPGPMLLFKAADATTQYLQAGDDLGWKAHVSGHIEVVPVSGSHDSIMTGNNLARLGTRLQQELDAINIAEETFRASASKAPALQPLFHA